METSLFNIYLCHNNTYAAYIYTNNTHINKSIKIYSHIKRHYKDVSTLEDLFEGLESFGLGHLQVPQVMASRRAIEDRLVASGRASSLYSLLCIIIASLFYYIIIIYYIYPYIYNSKVMIYMIIDIAQFNICCVSFSHAPLEMFL